MLWFQLLSSNNDTARLFSALQSWKYGIYNNEAKQTHPVLTLYQENLPLHLAIQYPLSNDTIRAVEASCDWESVLDDKGFTPLQHAISARLPADLVSSIVKSRPEALTQQDIDGLTPITRAILQKNSHETVLQMAVPLARSVNQEANRLISLKNWQGCKRLLKRHFEDHFSGLSSFDQHQVENIDAIPVEEACETLKRVYDSFLTKFGHLDIPEIRSQPPGLLHIGTGSVIELSVEAHGEPLSFQWSKDNKLMDGETERVLKVSFCATEEHNGFYTCLITNWRGSVVSQGTRVEVGDEFINHDPCDAYRIDPSTLIQYEVMLHINGKTGGVLNSPLGPVLSVPPMSFSIKDWFDTDVSDTVGLDVALRVVSPEALSVFLPLKQRYMSPIVQFRPDNAKVVFSPSVQLRCAHSCVLNRSHFNIKVVKLKELGKHGQEWHEYTKYTLSDTYVDIWLEGGGIFALVETALRSISLEHRQERSSLLIFTPEYIACDAKQITIHARLCPCRKDAVQCEMDALDAVEREVPLILSNRKDLMQHEKHPLQLNDSMVDEEQSFKIDGPFNQYLQEGIGLYQHEMRLVLERGAVEERLPIVITCRYPDLTQSPVQPALKDKYSKFIVLSIPETPSMLSVAKRYSPLFTRLELASFSKPFWDRYREVWWFKSGESPIVQRLFKPAHEGRENQIVVSTASFAASIRVRCVNFDSFGKFCPPVVLKPKDLEKASAAASCNEDDLLNTFNLSQYEIPINATDQYHRAFDRLLKEIDSRFQYTDHDQLFQTFGLMPNPKQTLLSRCRTCNIVLILLLKGLEEIQVVAARACIERAACLTFASECRFIHRLIPVLTVEYETWEESVWKLVQLVHQALVVVHKCSSGDWLSSFLLIEPLSTELQSIRVELNDTIASIEIFNTLNLFGSCETKDSIEIESIWRNYFHAIIRKDVFSSDQVSQTLLMKDIGVIKEALNHETFQETFEIIRDGFAIEKAIFSKTIFENPILDRMQSIRIEFIPRVCSIDPERVIRVINCTADSQVDGQVDVQENRIVTFTPTQPYDLRSEFECYLDGQAVETRIGPLSGELKLEFKTARRAS